MKRGRAVRGALAVAVALVLTGCGIPSDPDHTLDRIRERGEVIVGVSASPPILVVDGGAASGPEADVVTGWADAEGVRVRWVEGGQEALIAQLEHGDIDLLAAGLTDKTPWSDRVGLTRPWIEERDAYGTKVRRVLGVPLGENALLASIEAHIDGRRT